MPGFPSGAAHKGGQVAAETHRRSAREFYATLLPVVAELHSQGLSLRAIAGELGRRGHTARYGWQRWHPTQVRRMLNMLARVAAGEDSSVEEFERGDQPAIDCGAEPFGGADDPGNRSLLADAPEGVFLT